MKKGLRAILILFFAGTLALSAWKLGSYYLDGYRQQQRYDTLKTMKPEVTPRPAPAEKPDATSPAVPVDPLVTVTHPETGAQVRLLPEFRELYLLNTDLIGWLTIPGTDIDYPVMQTPDRPDYYLKRDFDRQRSGRGCLYAREVCDVFAPSDNVTLYGHRMKDGSMFGQLDRYMKKDFWEENPYLYFDTLQQLGTYQVMAVFLTTATPEEGFAYHSFVEAADESEFHSFVSTCKDLALYDTGVEAVYGDRFLTLSTCEYSQENGRLVVVAIRRDHHAAD